ncbi:hypothetical protein ABEV54_18310 [Peribacillus psychrosaccharolyticus]|uniref:hypothetical protein n=1 Tax=Peribacillus psychrosaccharolyticus TaxID=1407 RepID=UPI003D27DDCF
MQRSILTKEEGLYLEQMQEWIEEQEMIKGQLKSTVDHYVFIASSNTKQLSLHQERVGIGRKEFDEWKAENGI